jgi:hypothetical protein
MAKRAKVGAKKTAKKPANKPPKTRAKKAATGQKRPVRTEPSQPTSLIDHFLKIFAGPESRKT